MANIYGGAGGIRRVLIVASAVLAASALSRRADALAEAVIADWIAQLPGSCQ